MEWQNLFTEIILTRGYDYYLSDTIKNMNVSNQTIKAIIAGYQNYEVEIKLEGDNIVKMTCSCPYASDGNNCKHMAAVLYKWQDEYKENIPSVTERSAIKNEHLEKLINKASDKQIKHFLYSLLSNDEKLFLKFKTLVEPNISSSDLKRYKREINKTVRSFLGRDQFINYMQAPAFINAMDKYLYEDVKMMLENGCNEGAFELTCYLFLKVGSVDIDDSRGELGMFASDCLNIWREILNNGNRQLEDKMYQWFIEQLDGSLIDYLEEYLEDILMNYFKEPKYLKEKLVFIQKKIMLAKKQKQDWFGEFETSKWIFWHLKVMEELNYPIADIDDYCKENWQYTNIRNYYIDKCIERKDYQKAIEVLKESINLDKGYPGRIKEQRNKLKELYKLTNNLDAYQQELWQLVTKDDPGNLEIFNELKKLYPKEKWIEVREEIFKVLPKYVRIDKLYLAEKMEERLLNYVLNERGLYALYEYEDILKPKYTKELLQKYYDELNLMASCSADRKKYRQWVATLKRMQKLDGGAKIVNEIVETWKKVYKSRKAMMDELKKL